MSHENTLLNTAFEGKHNIRILGTPEEPWFVAKEICQILEIANDRDSVSRLDDDEKGVATTDTLGGNQEVNIISESGLYQLIFQSRKPEAKRFRKWVTKEVLPEIRRNGFYMNTGGVPSAVSEINTLTLRLEAAKHRLEAETLERRARQTNNLSGAVPIGEWLRNQQPELTHKQIANLTRSIKRKLRATGKPTGTTRHKGNTCLTARPDDLNQMSLQLT